MIYFEVRVKFSGPKVIPEWEGRNFVTNNTPRFIGLSHYLRRYCEYMKTEMGVIVRDRWSQRIK